MASERVRFVPNSPEPGWTTELSDLFAFDKRSGWSSRAAAAPMGRASRFRR